MGGAATGTGVGVGMEAKKPGVGIVDGIEGGGGTGSDVTGFIAVVGLGIVPAGCVVVVAPGVGIVDGPKGDGPRGEGPADGMAKPGVGIVPGIGSPEPSCPPC